MATLQPQPPVSYRGLIGPVAGVEFDAPTANELRHRFGFARIVNVPADRLVGALSLAKLIPACSIFTIDKFAERAGRTLIHESVQPLPRYDHVYAAGTDWLNRGGDE